MQTYLFSFFTPTMMLLGFQNDVNPELLESHWFTVPGRKSGLLVARLLHAYVLYLQAYISMTCIWAILIPNLVISRSTRRHRWFFQSTGRHSVPEHVHQAGSPVCSTGVLTAEGNCDAFPPGKGRRQTAGEWSHPAGVCRSVSCSSVAVDARWCGSYEASLPCHCRLRLSSH